MRGLRLVFALGTACGLAACNGSPGTSTVTSSIAPPSLPALGSCETVAANIQTPVGVNGSPVQGVLGPLYVRPDGHGDGYPNKVLLLLQDTSAPAGPFTLRGRNCQSGRPLRFAYSENLPSGPQPMGDAALARAGATNERLPRIEPPAEAYTGYMLFTAAGRWLVELDDGSIVAGRLIIDVRQ
jgi:hypothetical protein